MKNIPKFKQTNRCLWILWTAFNWYLYISKWRAFFITGECNGRVGDYEDFISGVDDIPDRENVGFKTNAYGEKLIEFLIDSTLCILNGRST